ncbi:MAG: sialidase family protein, partial [Pseudohongiella sp.]|nr:sialidase family protein [Pseudohongiella sp.]
MRFILIFALLFPAFAHAQSWEVLQAPSGVRNTFKLLAHGNVLFHYEDKTLRSADAGQTWTEVTGLTDRVTAMVSIGQDVYAVRMQSPPAAMIFLKSSDNGQSWTEISRP